MSLSVPEVTERLGLIPFDEYPTCPERLAWVARMQNGFTQDISNRATGRTTRMICGLLAHLSGDQTTPVYIHGHRGAYTNILRRRAQEYASKLGLDPGMIKPFYSDPHVCALRQGLVVFSDHFEAE